MLPKNIFKISSIGFTNEKLRLRKYCDQDYNPLTTIAYQKRHSTYFLQREYKEFEYQT